MAFRFQIEGQSVTCLQEGKQILSVELTEFLRRLSERSDVCPIPEAIPDGVCFVRRRQEVVALVIEEKPQLRTVRWLADDSPVPFGRGARYRTARLAFPFVIVVVLLRNGALTGYQQCFYRTAPLRLPADDLLLPNLYNVAIGYGMQCWLCLANLQKSRNLSALPWFEKVAEIRKHLWGAGFNKSSELHEGMSYWQAMRSVDPRVQSVDRWEAESRADPFFPLKVRWKPAEKSVSQVIEEMFSHFYPTPVPGTAEELAQHFLSSPSMRGKMFGTLFPFDL